MFRHREAVATCTGEQADSWMEPARQQTENVSQERTPPDLSRNSGVLTGSILRPGAPGVRAGRLVAGSVRNTKDRDGLALEVRAGTSGVGRTCQDAAGLSSTNRNRVKVARTPVKNSPQSLCSETRG